MSIYGININKESELSLRRQIYQSIRDQITDGKLREDEELPSTRELAKQLDISRNTVSEAYDMLLAEGYIISHQGTPSRIADGLSLAITPNSVPQENRKPSYPIIADFHTGRPDLRLFPRYLWQQLQNKAFAAMPEEQFGYSGPQGLFLLRKEIAAWLYRSRGLITDPQDIFITAGATQALHLIADLLSSDRKEIIMEDPCHLGMRQTFLRKGCTILPVPVDEQGMRTEFLKSTGNTCAVYVTPSHQFPLGGILPASRRASLIQFARENDIYIIEDDYDSEFRYCGEPIAPLYSMDPQSVIYVGTFSKTLFPALRIGYVLLPRKLHRMWKELRTYADVQNPVFDQATLAEFLLTRKLDRHIQKMRRIYGERRSVLINSIKEEFRTTCSSDDLNNSCGSGELSNSCSSDDLNNSCSSEELRNSGSSEKPVNFWHAYGDEAGLHIALEFPGMVFDEVFRKNCLREGIYITPLEQHCIQKGMHQNKLLLGYGHLEPDEIRRAVHMLHEFMVRN